MRSIFCAGVFSRTAVVAVLWFGPRNHRRKTRVQLLNPAGRVENQTKTHTYRVGGTGFATITVKYVTTDQ